MAEQAEQTDPHVLARIDDWRRRLIDLSYRNRLINFKATKASTLQIDSPSIHDLFVDPERTKPWGFYLPPELDDEGDPRETSDAADFVDEAVLRAVEERPPAADEIVVSERDPKRINRVLDTLAKRSNAELQDKAIRTLFLALGFLDWVDPARGL